MQIPISRRGGDSGTDLNFMVVGGTTQPENPKENTIWVDTDQEITEWSFRTTEPEAPTDGMIWFVTGTNSPVSFDALSEENEIVVYVFKSKQYDSNSEAWTELMTKVYTGGEWINFDAYLCTAGIPNTKYTGEWKNIGKGISQYATATNKLTITNNTGSIKMTQTGSSKGGMFYTSKKIDLTPYKTLVFEGSVYSSSTNAVWVVLAAWSDIGAYFSENQKAKQSLADKSGSYKFNIDVSSLNGDYYIGFAIYHTDTEIVLRNLYLIPK